MKTNNVEKKILIIVNTITMNKIEKDATRVRHRISYISRKLDFCHVYLCNKKQQHCINWLKPAIYIFLTLHKPNNHKNKKLISCDSKWFLIILPIEQEKGKKTFNANKLATAETKS